MAGRTGPSYPRVVLRVLAILLLTLALALASEGDAHTSGLGELTSAQALGDNCCPERPGHTDDEGDCCDFDFGRCCSGSMVALVTNAGSDGVRRPNVGPPHAGTAPQRLLAQTTGPPPTPPPIA